jgi:mannose/fructose/N-acetylgalactosamine-specific phosphotransferase system component IIC
MGSFFKTGRLVRDESIHPAGGDGSMMPQWPLLSLLLAFLSLDILAVGQFMMSRPIVVGPLTGFLTGNPGLGLEMGALIELIWISDLPVGAHLPMDLTILTGVAVALASELSGKNIPVDAAVTYSIGIAIPLALVSMQAELLIRKFHVKWMHLAQRMALASRLTAFEWVNRAVLLEIFLKGFLTAAAALTAAHLVGPAFFMFPPRVLEGLAYARWLLLALGCSAVIDMLMDRQTALYLFLSITVILSLAVLVKVQETFLVALTLFVGLTITLFFAGKGESS